MAQNLAPNPSPANRGASLLSKSVLRCCPEGTVCVDDGTTTKKKETEDYYSKTYHAALVLGKPIKSHHFRCHASHRIVSYQLLRLITMGASIRDLTSWGSDMAREVSLSPWDTTVRLRAYGDLDVQTPKGSSRRDQRDRRRTDGWFTGSKWEWLNRCLNWLEIIHSISKKIWLPRWAPLMSRTGSKPNGSQSIRECINSLFSAGASNKVFSPSDSARRHPNRGPSMSSTLSAAKKKKKSKTQRSKKRTDGNEIRRS